MSHKRKYKPNFQASCAAFGQTKGLWITSFRGLASKRRIRREYAKAKVKAIAIRKQLKKEGFFDEPPVH